MAGQYLCYLFDLEADPRERRPITGSDRDARDVGLLRALSETDGTTRVAAVPSLLTTVRSATEPRDRGPRPWLHP